MKSRALSLIEAASTVLLDCDGVVLDSNDLKAETFYEVVRPFGEANAKTFLEYHYDNGGISRYDKFRYFFRTVLGREFTQSEYTSLLQRFADLVDEKLMNAPFTDGAIEFLEKWSHIKKIYLISAGDESEWRSVFRRRNLDPYFINIFGSPKTKVQIFDELLRKAEIDTSAIYIGDSEHDFNATQQCKLSFIFMSGYTRFKGWDTFFVDKQIETVENFRQLV